MINSYRVSSSPDGMVWCNLGHYDARSSKEAAKNAKRKTESTDTHWRVIAMGNNSGRNIGRVRVFVLDAEK